MTAPPPQGSVQGARSGGDKAPVYFSPLTDCQTVNPSLTKLQHLKCTACQTPNEAQLALLSGFPEAGSRRTRLAHRVGGARVRHHEASRTGTDSDSAPSNWTGRGPCDPAAGGRRTRLSQSGTLFATPGTCSNNAT